MSLEDPSLATASSPTPPVPQATPVGLLLIGCCFAICTAAGSACTI